MGVIWNWIKNLSVEDWILIVIAAVIIFFIVGGLTSCAVAQKGAHMDILCVGPDGEIFHAQGAGVQQGKMMENEWDLGACDIGVHNTQSSAITPPKKKEQ